MGTTLDPAPYPVIRGSLAAMAAAADSPAGRDGCAAAWFRIGIQTGWASMRGARQNYMLSIKRAPVRWFLRLTGAQTDRGIGIEKLKLAAEKGHYLAPFAQLMLAVAALRGSDPNRARELLSGLARLKLSPFRR